MEKHKHIYRQYKDPFGDIYHFCEVCGYNKELGFVAEKFIVNETI